MLKLMIHGYLGKMGKVLCRLAEQDETCEVVSGIDFITSQTSMPFSVFTDINDCDVPADVIIDFSTADAVPSLINYAVSFNIPVVICTTGLSNDTIKKIDEAAEKIPVFRSANMSIGINLIAALLEKASKTLDEVGFNIEIIEKHHNQKIDAPSGTALLLADTINRSMDNKLRYVYDRSPVREKRDAKELGIHAIRGGTIVGEHSVIFAGKDEVVEFTHIAHSKEVFAVGAFSAAKFLADKPAGLYDMNDMLKNLI